MQPGRLLDKLLGILSLILNELTEYPLASHSIPVCGVGLSILKPLLKLLMGLAVSGKWLCRRQSTLMLLSARLTRHCTVSLRCSISRLTRGRGKKRGGA